MTLEVYRALALDDRVDPRAELERIGLRPPVLRLWRGAASVGASAVPADMGAEVKDDAPQASGGPVSQTELMAALPQVLAAPKTDAPIQGLCFQPGLNLREFPMWLRMTLAEGIPGNRWLSRPWLRLLDGRPDPRIQVSIPSSRILDPVWRDRHRVPHPGDTLVADLDTSLANLPEGSLLRAGSATLRLSGLFNDGRAKWTIRYGRPAKNWIVAPGHPELRLRGILCEVVEDGEVTLSDRFVRLS